MILDFFPYEEQRKCQTDTLLELEKEWDNFDVFVISAPTGSGKSGIAATLQSWELSKNNSCAYIVPNNILRDQLLDDFDHMRTVKAQEEYWIEKYNMTEKEFRTKIYKYGPRDSQYTRDRNAVRRVGTPVVVNYHSYIAHKLQRNTLIVDEAHQLLHILQDMNSRKIWRHLYGYPLMARTPADVLSWIDSKKEKGGLLTKLRNQIQTLDGGTVLEMGKDMYRGAVMDCLKLIPLDVSSAPPIFWPNKTKKIVLMSATIGEQDIKSMGLDNRRVLYLEVESPIPEENRPVVYAPVADMSMRNQKEALPVIAEKILGLAAEHPGKGFIHATYDVAYKLKEFLADNDRFMFHDNTNKSAVYEEFYESDPQLGKIMVGSGMSEGIDLKYDAATWQVLVKCPFPSLMNPAMRWLLKNRPEVYDWMTTKEILQACGRVCRDPTDYGITYLIDNSFERWYNKVRKILPSWFKMKGI